jgi:hypothetical protein
VIGLIVGFEPSTLPPAVLDLAVYKLTFGAAAGLLAAGAIVRRYTNRVAGSERQNIAATASPPAGLGPGSIQDDLRQRERTPIDVRPR